MSELRKDPVTPRWVLIAPERGVRPSDFVIQEGSKEGRLCPFCPEREHLTPPAILTVPSRGGGWKARVIPNRFPAVGVEEEFSRNAVGIYDQASGFGAHEVIVETPSHEASLWEISDEDRAAVFRVYRDRLSDLGNDRRLRWGMVFKNRGAEAGATLRHEHSQLIALPMVPREAMDRLRGAAAYFEQKERCVYCDIVDVEQKGGERFVDESRFFFAFCPYASRTPFETWILPKVHASHFTSLTIEDSNDLAEIMGRILRRMDVALERPALNCMLHSAPLQERESRGFHWHLEIAPAVQRMGGFEWGSGFSINPTSPEEAARFLSSKVGV